MGEGQMGEVAVPKDLFGQILHRVWALSPGVGWKRRGADNPCFCLRAGSVMAAIRPTDGEVVHWVAKRLRGASEPQLPDIHSS